jgi:hypothetical protein
MLINAHIASWVKWRRMYICQLRSDEERDVWLSSNGLNARGNGGDGDNVASLGRILTLFCEGDAVPTHCLWSVHKSQRSSAPHLQA